MKIIGMAIIAIFIAGCAGVDTTETDSREVNLPDGRTVTCVVSDGNKSGGIDCDWDNVG